jgi:hypothetical protein
LVNSPSGSSQREDPPVALFGGNILANIPLKLRDEQFI